MKLCLINDEGKVVGTLEDVETYDLTKPAAHADIIESIRVFRYAAGIPADGVFKRGTKAYGKQGW
jgi:hypothetical protein